MSAIRRVATAVLAAAIGVAAAPAAAQVATSATPHRGLVVANSPERKGARINGGLVFASDQVGNVLIVGGSFTDVQLADGTVVAQPYLAAFDVVTGDLVPEFRPVVDKEVLVVEAGADNTVFVGGKFATINSAPRVRLAKLSAATGEPVADWRADVNGTVTTMDRIGIRLFIGGEFTRVKAKDRSRLAELSAVNARVSDTFVIDVVGRRDRGYRSDGFYYEGNGNVVKSIRVTPDGRKLIVMHRGATIGGQRRPAVAQVNIAVFPAEVTDWHSNLWDARPFFNLPDYVGVVDGDISPDGSMVVITTASGNFPPVHDTVIAFPLAGEGLVRPLWVTQMFDSAYAVAISDAAVYVGGHFCWTEGPEARDDAMYWPGDAGNTFGCFLTGASRYQPRTVYRYHLAALDSATGQALAWDPKSNDSSNGVQFLDVVPAGLIVGHDGTRFNEVNVGRMGWFRAEG